MPKFNKDFLPVAKPSQPDLRSLELHSHIGAHNLACLGEQFANAAEAGRPNCVCCVNQILRGWGSASVKTSKPSTLGLTPPPTGKPFTRPLA